jgi:hypothetical protein
LPAIEWVPWLVQNHDEIRQLVSISLLVFCLASTDHAVVLALPNNFIAEVVTDVHSIEGTFAPNPHHPDKKPMLLLISKQGQVQAPKDPTTRHAPLLFSIWPSTFVPTKSGVCKIFWCHQQMAVTAHSTRVGDCSAKDEP